MGAAMVGLFLLDLLWLLVLAPTIGLDYFGSIEVGLYAWCVNYVLISCSSGSSHPIDYSASSALVFQQGRLRRCLQSWLTCGAYCPLLAWLCSNG